MNTSFLPTGYNLQNRYIIESVIGQGGFGITYRARHINLDKIVCVKELFIKNVNKRKDDHSLTNEVSNFSFGSFLDRFVGEARKISYFEHSNIVRVNDLFLENNTAYIAMEFIEGETLKKKINGQELQNETEKLAVIYQLLDAVEEIHNKQIIHRDIKPDNIIVRPDGKVVLIDFGTAKDISNEETIALGNDTTIILTPGFAAPEQYSPRKSKANYTDIYAIGATFYNLMTSCVPEAVNDRINGFNPDKLDKDNIFYQFIMKAMEMEEASRYQSISEMRAELDKIYGNPPLPYPTPIPTPTPKKNLKIELLYKLNKFSAVLKENNFTQKLFYEFDTTKKYKFEPGGTLLILEGSKIERGRWQKISDKDLLLNEGSGEFNYNLIFKDNNLLCINKSGTKTNLLLVHDSMKDNIGEYIKSIYTNFNKAAHGTLSGGEKILVYDAEGKGWDEMIGCKVSIDYQDPKDGDYYNSDNSRVYVIKDGTFAAVRFLKNITTNSGLKITIETRREGSVSHNDLVYTKEGAVPDGTYRWGIFTFIKVKNSKVDDWFGMI